MCEIVFEKAKVRGGTVNKTSFYTEAAVLLQKRSYEKFRKIHKKESVLESLF